MQQYRNVHLWLMLPFAVVMLGFMYSYWLRFPDAPFRHHLHGLSATLWFVLLILQPWLITRGHRQSHRFYGMIALVVAGGVALSALGVIPYNLVNERLPEVARYGLSFVDIVLAPGFLFAVIMAIVNARNPDDHARWMISTVFWAVSPGLFRLMFIPMGLLQVPDPFGKAPLMLGTAGLVNLVVLGILMWRDGRAHPAYVSAAIGSLVLFVPMTVGGMPWWQNLANAIFTI